MPRNTEAKLFFAMIAFLLCYTGFLLVLRVMLVNVEEKNHITLFKPELLQIMVMALLILLYHFCFLGLYFFSQGNRSQKIAAALIGIIITGSLLYGFNAWYQATSNPFFPFNDATGLPWYAKEKPKFLLANIPILVFLITVFVFRVIKILKPAR